ncbi:MAG: hypothetical protein ABIW38_06680 [Ferruginibacter sp.]
MQVEPYFLLLWNEKKRKPETADRLYTEAANSTWNVLAEWTAMQYEMMIMRQAYPLQLFLPFLIDRQSAELFIGK